MYIIFANYTSDLQVHVDNDSSFHHKQIGQQEEKGQTISTMKYQVTENE